MENNYYVYLHINKINNMIYIGITSMSPKKRWENGNGYRNNEHFYRAIKKYGWGNFKHIILHKNLTKEEACEREIELIAKYKSNNPNFGYNKALGGQSGMKDYKHTEETRKKISLMGIGRKQSEETRKKRSETLKGRISPMKGRHQSEDAKRKIGIASKNRIVSEETRKKLSTLLKGKKVSEEHRKKLREAQLGKHFSQETRRKMSESRKGRIVSKETREKLSKALKGTKPTQYTIQKSIEKNSKKVICIETGEIYNSILDASKKTRVNNAVIGRVCMGKSNIAGGYHWEYYMEA